MTENFELADDQKCQAITEATLGLEENDYTARKVAFELAAAFKTLYPDVELPNYEKYKNREVQADEYRRIINDNTSA